MAPGVAQAEKIVKFAQKNIITETSANKHAWKNAAGLHGGPPPTLKNGVL